MPRVLWYNLQLPYLFNFGPQLMKQFFIISCGFLSNAAYDQGWLSFFISLFYRKVQMTLIFSWLRFFDQTLFAL